MILIKNIKSFQPTNFLLFILIGLMAWVKPFLSKEMGGVYFDNDPMPLYNWLYSYLSAPNLAFLCKIILLFLIFLQAIIINGITNQYNLLGFRTYLPGIIFIIITANFTKYQILHPVIIANLFLLLAWERISSISEKSNSFKVFFNAAVFLGIATLFYPNYIYFIFILFIATMLNRISHIREFFMIVLGFAMVWYFHFSLNFIFYNKFQLAGIEPELDIFNIGLNQLSKGHLIFLLFIGLLLIMANLQLSTYISSAKIQIRRNLKLLFIWFIIGITVFLFTKSSFELIFSIAIPVSFLFSIFFANIKNFWIRELTWLLILSLTIINQYFPQFL